MKHTGQGEGPNPRGACRVTPRRLPADHSKLIADLSSADPRLAPVFLAIGPFPLRSRKPTLYQFCRAIIGQQLSTVVADRIADRFRDSVGDDDSLTPGLLLAASDETLRAVGLSGAKTRTVRALAEYWRDNGIEPEHLTALPDEEILARFTSIKGIGPWTVKMILIFCLCRPDVLPIEDLGLRMGLRRLDGLDELPGPATVAQRAEVWRPWRTVATWYCWQLLKLKELPR